MEKNRRSLTPSVHPAAGDVHATRRAGARHEISKRVTVKRLSGVAAGCLLDGWALNVSRGGLRVILEEKVEPGDDVEVTLLDARGSDDPTSGNAFVGRIVWVQEEHDGVVAGIAFARGQGPAPSEPPPPVEQR